MVKRQPAAQRTGKGAGMLDEGQMSAGDKLCLGLWQVAQQLQLVKRRDDRVLTSDDGKAGLCDLGHVRGGILLQHPFAELADRFGAAVLQGQAHVVRYPRGRLARQDRGQRTLETAARGKAQAPHHR
ncbi:hypothetical protein KU6B_10140 [Mameliella alba]|nr:hypothetical protein [Mameliella alba]BBU54749.1 hypothetical protein KU6B_10140 [Mameliella alba]